MAIFVLFYHVFPLKFEEKNTPKHDFGDARGDEKQVIFLEWPYD